MNGRCRVVWVGILGVAVSGCSSTLAECVKRDSAVASSSGAVLAVPKGCWTEGPSSDSVQAIFCENGRQGYVFSN